METNQIAKAGTAAGIATLLLIVCIILLSGCQTSKSPSPATTPGPVPNEESISGQYIGT